MRPVPYVDTDFGILEGCSEKGPNGKGVVVRKPYSRDPLDYYLSLFDPRCYLGSSGTLKPILSE